MPAPPFMEDPRPRPSSRPADLLGARCPNATDSDACRGVRAQELSACAARQTIQQAAWGPRHSGRNQRGALRQAWLAKGAETAR